MNVIRVFLKREYCSQPTPPEEIEVKKAFVLCLVFSAFCDYEQMKKLSSLPAATEQLVYILAFAAFFGTAVYLF